MNRYNAYLDENEFGLALDVVEKFFWNNFCDNYLELIKDQLFNPENYTEFELKATRWTLVSYRIAYFANVCTIFAAYY